MPNRKDYSELKVSDFVLWYTLPRLAPLHPKPSCGRRRWPRSPGRWARGIPDHPLGRPLAISPNAGRGSGAPVSRPGSGIL